MIGLTATYLILCVLFIVMCQFKPLILELRRRNESEAFDRAAQLLSQMDLPLSDIVPLVANPIKGPIYTEKEDGSVRGWEELARAFVAKSDSPGDSLSVKPKTENFARVAKISRSPMLKPRLSLISLFNGVRSKKVQESVQEEGSQNKSSTGRWKAVSAAVELKDPSNFAERDSAVQLPVGKKTGWRTFSFGGFRLPQRETSGQETTTDECTEFIGLGSPQTETAEEQTENSILKSVSRRFSHHRNTLAHVVNVSEVECVETLPEAPRATNETDTTIATPVSKSFSPQLQSYIDALPTAQQQVITSITDRKNTIILSKAQDDSNSTTTSLVVAALELTARIEALHTRPTTHVIIAAPSAAAAENIFKEITKVLSEALDAGNPVTLKCALFTEAMKFAEDVRRIATDGEPALAVGSLRRITDLVSRGAIQGSTLGCFILEGADQILPQAASVAHVGTILAHVDRHAMQFVVISAKKTPDFDALVLGWSGMWETHEL
jgi:hypothetical protein